MGPLSALIRSANAISGQITSFRLVMTDPWTLSEVITGKSGCEWGQKERWGVIEDKIVSGEGDEIGWRSILIWRQNRGMETERHSCAHECVFVWIVFKSDSSANHPGKWVWPRYGGWRRSRSTQIHKFVTLWAPKGCRQSEYIFDHSTALWQEGREGEAREFDDRDSRQMCDRHRSYSCWQAFSSVWDGRMDGWTDEVGWREMCLGVLEVSGKKGELWKSEHRQTEIETHSDTNRGRRWTQLGYSETIRLDGFTIFFSMTDNLSKTEGYIMSIGSFKVNSVNSNKYGLT